MTKATTPSLSSLSVDQLFLAYQEDKTNHTIRNELVERFMPMVYGTAKKLSARLPRYSQVGRDDLVSAGFFGLIKAVETFDPSRNVEGQSNGIGKLWQSYGSRKVWGAMVDELRRVGHTRRIKKNWEIHDVAKIISNHSKKYLSGGAEDEWGLDDFQTDPLDDSPPSLRRHSLRG